MDINTLLQSQMVSTLLGVIVGGLITFFVTTYSVNRQFAHQEKLYNQVQTDKKRMALVTIREELLHNGVINNKAIHMMDHEEGCEQGIKMPSGWIEFERLEWNTFKNMFLFATDNEELIANISWLYYQFSVCNTTRILTRETATNIEEVISEVAKELNDLLNELN